jgi:hypothetical protein
MRDRETLLGGHFHIQPLEENRTMPIVLLACPTCNAKQGEPCRTPSGRKKMYCGQATIHDTRPFSITTTEE